MSLTKYRNGTEIKTKIKKDTLRMISNLKR